MKANEVEVEFPPDGSIPGATFALRIRGRATECVAFLREMQRGNLDQSAFLSFMQEHGIEVEEP